MKILGTVNLFSLLTLQWKVWIDPDKKPNTHLLLLPNSTGSTPYKVIKKLGKSPDKSCIWSNVCGDSKRTCFNLIKRVRRITGNLYNTLRDE